MKDKSLEDLAIRMSRIFTGNTSWHYTADFKNLIIEAGGKRIPQYRDVKGPPTTEEFIAHLKGEMGLLVIPITKAGATRFGKIDIDEYPLDLPKFAKSIARYGLPLIAEYSKSKGGHLANYSQHNESAVDFREKLADWAAALRLKPSVEIFPKQDKLLDGEPGSGINLPYFGGDSEATRNFAIDKDGNRLTVAEWLDIAERMPSKPSFSPGLVNVEGAADILSRHWTDGQRDNLNIAALGTMLRAGVDTGTAQEIIEASSDISMDDGSRKSALTVEKAMDDGKRVPGFPKLVEIMGEEDAHEFMRLIGGKPPKDLVAVEIRPMPESWATESPPPVVYAIDPMMPRRVVTVTAAEGGAGKTSFGLSAAIAVAGNRPFFGLPVTQGIAVYFALEENEHSLHRRLHQGITAEIRRMKAEGLSLERIEQFHSDLRSKLFPVAGAGIELHFILSTKGDVGMNEGVIDRLIEKMPPSPALVVADPIARVHGTEENANHVATALINAGDRIAQRTGAAFVYMHHIGKDAIRNRDTSMNAARGGSALIAGARSSIRLAPVVEYFDNVPPAVIAAGDLIEVIHNKLNDGKKYPPFFLRRQAFAFERFEPQASSNAVRHAQLISALFNWFVGLNERKGFSVRRVDDADDRGEMFRPLTVGRDKARAVVQRAIDDGDIIESTQVAPRTKDTKLLIFRGDFGDGM